MTKVCRELSTCRRIIHLLSFVFSYSTSNLRLFFIAGRFFPEKGIFSFLSSGISYPSFSFLFEVGRRFLVVDR